MESKYADVPMLGHIPEVLEQHIDLEVAPFRLDYTHGQAWNEGVHTTLGEASERTNPLTIVDDNEFDGMDSDELLAGLNEDDLGYKLSSLPIRALCRPRSAPRSRMPSTPPGTGAFDDE
ncbi:hypothetical protein NWP13_22325 [Rhodococcus pyridinivorans]|nr:hypothetical protein [Rhodococcus pyridinivorans]